MKRTPLAERVMPEYSRGEEICNMVTHIVGGALGIAALYALGKKRRYVHSVFHIFVVIGSILHFFCIFFYVI